MKTFCARPPATKNKLINPRFTKINKFIINIFNSWKYIIFPHKLKNKLLYDNHIFIKNIYPIPKHFHGYGKEYLFDRLHYKGDFSHGLYNGHGTLYISENDTYIGQFKDGKFNGYGEYHKYNKLIYHGQWSNGIRNGIGKEFYNDILVYNGMWKYNQKNGMGKLYDYDYIVYEGLWKHNKKNGYGEEFDKDGNKLKEGLWNNNSYINDLHEDLICIVCFKEKRSIAFIPCGHLCMCKSCSHKYNKHECIVCRKPYQSINKIFI